MVKARAAVDALLPKESAQELLIRWVHKVSGVTIANVTADLSDGTVLLKVLHAVSPETCVLVSPEAMASMSALEKCDAAQKEAEALLGADHAVNCSNSLVGQHRVNNLALLSHIMAVRPCVPVPTDDLCRSFMTESVAAMKEALRGVDELVGDDDDDEGDDDVAPSGSPGELRIRSHDHAAGKVMRLQKACEACQASVAASNRLVAHTGFDIAAASRTLISELNLCARQGSFTELCNGAGTHNDGHADSNQEWWKLRPAHVYDLFDRGMSAEEKAQVIMDVETVLKAHAMKIKEVFRYYCQADARHGGGADPDYMNAREFMVFCLDCEIIDSRTSKKPKEERFRAAKAEMIFINSNREFEADDTNPDTDMTGVEFVESLLRLGMEKLPSKTPARSVQRLMENYILPHASQVDRSDFQLSMSRPEMLTAIRKHTPKMRKVFEYFSALDPGDHDVKHSTTMNLEEFVLMAEKANLFTDAFKRPELTNIFVYMQSTFSGDGPAPSQDDLDTELVFGEFVEVVVCCCMYHNPSPFIPLHVRFENFLSKHVFPALSGSLGSSCPF